MAAKSVAENVLFGWSGGKDSALALYELAQRGGYSVSALLTTITADYDRISMHGVPRVLLEEQVKSLGLKLEKVLISRNASNEEYEKKMKDVLLRYKKEGILSVVFGDLFLEDVRIYRESNLSKVGMKGIYPLWGKPTREISLQFIELGFKAIITCVDSEALGKEFVGQLYDKKFLKELPPKTDPCGENGEFHSFVYDGPLFGSPVSLETGQIVLKENRFYFCDLLPKNPVLIE